VHVLLVEGLGTRSEVPLAPRGTLGLVMSGAGGEAPPPTAWTLHVDPTAVPA